MNSKYHIAKRKYVYDVFKSILGTIFAFFMVLAFLAPEGEDVTFEIGLTEFYLLIGVFVVSILVQLVLYWLILRRHVFSDQEKSFLVEQGLFLKRQANIPYKNIHTISLKRRFWDLILGLSVIEIDSGTTASFKSEGRLVLDKQYALVLKNFLETKKLDDSLVLPSPNDFVAQTAKKSASNYLKWHQLFALALMKQSFLPAMFFMVLSILVGGSIVIQFVEEATLDQNFIHVIYVSFASLLVSSISTMIYHFIKYYRYTYQIDEDTVTYSYGLFKRVELKSPIKRINAVHLNQPILFRLFGYYQLNISVLGVGELSEGNEFKVESKSILMLAKLQEVHEVLAQIGFMSQNFEEEIVPKQFKYLNFVILPMFFLILLNILPYLIFSFETFDVTIFIILQVLVVLVLFIGAVLKVRQHKISFHSHEFLFQRGSFTLMKTIVKKQRIQLFSYQQGPLLLIEKIGNIGISYKDILGFIIMKNFSKESFNRVKRFLIDS